MSTWYDIEVLGGEGEPTGGGWTLEFRGNLLEEAQRVYASLIAEYGEEFVDWSED